MDTSKILDWKSIKLEEDDILVIRITKDKLPTNKFLEFAEKIKKELKERFPNNKILVTSDELEVTTQKEE